MDNVAKAFAQKIVSELEKIAHLLSVGPPRENDGQRDAPTDQSDPTPPETPRKIPVIPPAPPGQSKTDNPGSEAAPWWRGAQIVGIFAAIAVAWINGCQWRDANRNFTLDERPWVRIDVFQNLADPQPAGKFTFNVGQPLNLGIYLRNSGKTPAINVTSYLIAQIAGIDDVMAFPNNPNGTPPLNGRPVVGEEKRLGKRLFTGIIFPDQFFPVGMDLFALGDDGKPIVRPLSVSAL
jgi:hypothetical protein